MHIYLCFKTSACARPGARHLKPASLLWLASGRERHVLTCCAAVDNLSKIERLYQRYAWAVKRREMGHPTSLVLPLAEAIARAQRAFINLDVSAAAECREPSLRTAHPIPRSHRPF